MVQFNLQDSQVRQKLWYIWYVYFKPQMGQGYLTERSHGKPENFIKLFFFGDYHLKPRFYAMSTR